MRLIKICKIKDIQSTRLCGELGVHMLGLHCIDGMNLAQRNTYKRICEELARYYPLTVPVVVTKLTDPDAIARILKYLDIHIVQIHTPLNLHQATRIIKKLERVLERRPELIVVISADDEYAEQRILEMKDVADYILLDASYQGGRGIRVETALLKRLMQMAEPTRFLLAGGLTPENVADVLNTVTPYGVDVQTGVEADVPGHLKDPTRLMQFVSAVRKHSVSIPKAVRYEGMLQLGRPLVSIAATSVSPDEARSVLERFVATDIDLVHLDFSDGTIAPGFLAEPYYAVSELKSLSPCLPYDIHLFISDAQSQRLVLEQCLKINPLLRVALIHLAGFSDLDWQRLEKFSHIVNNVGVQLGLAVQATRFTLGQINNLLKFLEHYSTSEISLITRSTSHNLKEVQEFDLNLLSQITSWAKQQDKLIHVSVDREITFPKLRILSEGNPTHLVVGKALLSLRYPQPTITKMRALLTSPKKL